MTLSKLIAEARQAWPGVMIDDAAFAEHLAARGLDEEKLGRLKAQDLFLACACLRGDAAALAAFDKLLTREVEIAWARVDTPGADAGDAKQLLRTRLIVEGRLGEYGGRGDLRAWLRVIAMREALQLRRRLGREAPLDDLALVERGGADPELARMKQLYRAEFQQAFLETLAALDSRDRNLLRSHFLHGLGIDDLAPMFNVHRATAARWLVKLRKQLHDGTLERLAARLKLADNDLESVMRLIQSQLDVSLQRAFANEDR